MPIAVLCPTGFAMWRLHSVLRPSLRVTAAATAATAATAAALGSWTKQAPCNCHDGRELGPKTEHQREHHSLSPSLPPSLPLSLPPLSLSLSLYLSLFFFSLSLSHSNCAQGARAGTAAAAWRRHWTSALASPGRRMRPCAGSHKNLRSLTTVCAELLHVDCRCSMEDHKPKKLDPSNMRTCPSSFAGASWAVGPFPQTGASA